MILMLAGFVLVAVVPAGATGAQLCGFLMVCVGVAWMISKWEDRQEEERRGR
jgi:uncharacterized membrane protein HdeD (DUF308 family)